MAADVYDRLARHLDDLPGGYPRTESGVEKRILRRLFAPEDAELALHLTLIEEPARVIARRAGIPVDEARGRLEDMERRGLVYAYHRDGKEPEYLATQWVIGIYEFQVNRLDPDLVHDVEEYSEPWFDQNAWAEAPQLRTIPIGKSISVQPEVMPYEAAEALVRAQDTLAVMPCICRQEQRILGEGCDKPLESCLSMGMGAAYVIRNEMGREIDEQEALALLAQADEEGLVLQPGNAKEAQVICMCCGCCCGILRNIKRYPKPAAVVASPFVATLDTGSCSGCGVCETRCQMDAIVVDGDAAVLDADRCIGCGLCVTTCADECMSLVRKPEADQPRVPRNLIDTNIKLGQARGKLSYPSMVGMLVRSKVDRLLARST